MEAVCDCAFCIVFVCTQTYATSTFWQQQRSQTRSNSNFEVSRFFRNVSHEQICCTVTCVALLFRHPVKNFSKNFARVFGRENSLLKTIRKQKRLWNSNFISFTSSVHHVDSTHSASFVRRKVI